MRVLDLFSGCGGLSLGVSRAGGSGRPFEVVGGLDFHGPSVETWTLNHPDAHALQADIRKADVTELLRQIGEVELLVGGPSCQGFSTHGKRVADDPRNFLYVHFMRFVEKLRPEWVLMENVTGLLRYNRGAFRDSIIADFQRLGYVVSFAQLQAADYGVPQVRKRVFFVANRKGIPFFFPEPSHVPPERLADEVSALRPYVTVADAIGDLPPIGLGCDEKGAPGDYSARPFSELQSWARGGSDGLTLHFGAPAPPENLERIRRIPPRGDWLDIPAELLPERMKSILPKDCTTLYYRLPWDRPAYTITTVYRNVSSGAFTHPDEDRAITHREAARLQSFPDTYRFSATSLSRQIGNAVPPVLAEALGSAVLAHEQCYRGKRSIRDLVEFREEVRHAVEAMRARPRTSSGVSCPPLPQLRGLSHPISDAAWASLRRRAAAKRLEIGSQVDLRGVVNSLIYCANNGHDYLRAPGEYSPAATLLRFGELWSTDGTLQRLLSAVEESVSKYGAGSVSRRGGEPRPTRRKRPRDYPTHHFATVLYDVDPETLCSRIE